MTEFFGIILMTIVVEGIVTYTKEWFVDKKIAWQQFMAIGLGILVCVGYSMDLFALFGLASAIPHLGTTLTGILIARGSNYIFDLIKKLQSLGQSKAE